MKICMDLGGDIKNEPLKKKSSAPLPPCSIHNKCSLSFAPVPSPNTRFALKLLLK